MAPSDTPLSADHLARATELAEGLFPHQVDGVAFFLARRRAILADDMGLGKTRQSIVAMQAAEPKGPWLVVCPASVKRNWQREIHLALGDQEEVIVVDRKTPPPNKGYSSWVVLNYDIVKKHLAALESLQFVGFICDEAHYLKNYQAQRTKAVCKLVEAAEEPVVHCLTGTPMMNRPRELFPLLQLVNHPLGKSFLGYAKRYCDAHRGDFGWETKGASNLDELTVQLHGTMLRRTKDEVLDLPGKMRTWLTVDIPETTAKRGMQRLLATLFKDTSEVVSQEEDSQRLPPISRSKLLARLNPVRTAIAGAKMKHSIEFAKGLIEQGEKVVFYTCFQEAGEAIADAFPAEQIRFFTGSSSTDHRQKCVDDFQDNQQVRILCATLIAGGVGITLTAARHVIFNDLDWVPTHHWQAEDRAYRIGQQYPVNIYYFKAANSIDEFVGHVLETKSKMISAVVDGQPLDEELGAGDVFSALEAAVHAIRESDSMDTSDPLSTIGHAIEAFVENEQNIEITKQDPLDKPSKPQRAAVEALARALTPESTAPQAFRTPGSKPGTFYELKVHGTDVTCDCRGFGFRGQCKHARGLKDALAASDPLPAEYEPT